MNIEEATILLNDFLSRWNSEQLKNLDLSNYVGIGNKDTFCQWVETKTKKLGSIKGLPGSIKFGIYERKDKNITPKNYDNDNEFSWLKAYKCTNRNDAFNKVKNAILKTINYSVKGDFKLIDNLLLPDIFKWKIAFLYSNERLIPIYKRDTLFNIAKNLGLQSNRSTQISEIQSLMMQTKPPDLSVYEYMRQLIDKFGMKQTKSIGKKNSLGKKYRKRKAAQSRNVIPQLRKSTGSYIAEQKHNKLQEVLKNKLIEDYGKENVLLEENYVDIKLIQPDFITFYEIKSNSYASDCVRDALGQILFYSFYDNDSRIKKLVVVGQYPLLHNEIEFIQHLKSKYKIDLEYLNIEI